tara:strand:- start:4210 stop:5346 length:1137 start_codon:yes stop_codon:yes gene_type:complete
MSQRVGTVEIEDLIINYLNEKNKKVFHLGVGNFLKKNKNLYINNLLSKKFIEFSLSKSFLFYGRFSVFIQSLKGGQEIFNIFLNKKYTKLVVYTCLFPTPFLFLKAILKIFKIDNNIKIINFIQGTPSFLRENNQNKNIYFTLEDIIRKNIYRKLYSYSNHIICSSKKIADQLGNLVSAELIKVIPNGVIRQMPKKKDLSYLLKEDIDKKGFNLYFIGRLTSQKNIMRLLFEFCNLYKNDERIKLTIIGDGDLYKDAYEKYSKFRNIIFKGYLNNPWQSLEENAVVIVPSLWEEPGHVPLEAFLNNKRFLISKGCSLSEFINKDYRNKIVFDLADFSLILKNIIQKVNPKDWYDNFENLYKDFENFTIKSFKESINEL